MPCPIQAIQRDEPPGKAWMPLEVRAKNMAIWDFMAKMI